MDAADGQLPGLLVLAAAIAVGATLGLVTYRFARGRSMLTAMLQTAFLPEKRRRFLTLLSFEGVLVLLVAMVWGLTDAGLLADGPGSVVTAFLLLATIFAVGAQTWLGLAQSHLTDEQRRALSDQAPTILQSLVMAPVPFDPPGADEGPWPAPRSLAPEAPRPPPPRP